MKGFPLRLKLACILGRVHLACVTPPSPYERCAMGGPVHPWVHCPRSALPDSMWCKRHRPESAPGDKNGTTQ